MKPMSSSSSFDYEDSLPEEFNPIAKFESLPVNPFPVQINPKSVQQVNPVQIFSNFPLPEHENMVAAKHKVIKILLIFNILIKVSVMFI